MNTFDTIVQAMVMMDQPTTTMHRRRIAAMALAALAGFVVGQIVILEDGTQAVVELAVPSPVHAVVRRDRDQITIKSLHGSPEEAMERLQAEEWREVMGARSEDGGRLQ